MTLTPIGGQPTPRELVELAINNPLPNIDDLPPRSEFDISQSRLETELDDVASTQSDIRPVMRTRRSAVAVSESQTAMDAVAASQTAMDTIIALDSAVDIVVASQTAMDSVAASQTAMDAVIASQPTLDTVVASQTAMDAVAASTTAMNAVAASKTAVGTIAENPVAWGQFLSSSDATTEFWPSTDASEFWQYEGGVQIQTSANRFGGPALLLPGGTGDVASWEIDADSITQLSITDKITPGNRENNYQIVLDQDVVFSTSANNTAYTTRTIDISTFSGTVTLELRINGNDATGGDNLVSDITATQ
jgi:galactitol-specific phosphotransferase system IIB component